MSGEPKAPVIAFCLEYPLAVRGGVSVLVEELIEGLSGDYQIWLVSPDCAETIGAHPVAGILAGHLPFALHCQPPKRAFHREAVALAGRLKQLGVSLAHFHCGGTFGWGNRWPGTSIPESCAQLGIKTVWTTHLTTVPARVYRGPRYPAWVGRMLAPLARAGKSRQMRAVDAEIAVSDHDRDFLAREFPAGASRLKRIYHSRLEGNQAHSPKPRQPWVLAVGHIAYRKGQDILVRAFLELAERHPAWELHLAGHDGGDGCWQNIESMVRAHPEGRRVHLLGAHPRPAELMVQASVFVQPSLEEALGLALQEAIYHGCAAIGTRVGGIPEVIEEGRSGVLVEPADVGQLAAAIEDLITNAGRRELMGNKGRESVLSKGMIRPAMINHHRSLYRVLLS